MKAESMRARYSAVTDYRYKGFVWHKLSDILILVQCAVMCGLDKLEDIEEYGKNKHAWLKEAFGIERIPSDSTLSRVLNFVDAEVVIDCVIALMKEALGVTGDRIALEGKTICATAMLGYNT